MTTHKPDLSDEHPPAGEPAEEPAAEPISNVRLGIHWWQHQWLRFAVFAMLAACAGALAWWQFGPKSAPAPKRPSPHSPAVVAVTPSPTPEPTPVPYGGVLSAATRAAQLNQFSHPQTGETWLSTRKELPDLQYFEPGNSAVSYYEVGQRGTSTIIAGLVTQMSTMTDLFERTPDGNVTYIARPSAFMAYTDQGSQPNAYGLVSKIAVNTTQHYDSLSVPRELAFTGGYILTMPTWEDLGEPVDGAADNKAGITYTTVRTIGQSTLELASLYNADTKLTSILYYLHTPIGNRVRVDYSPTELDIHAYNFSVGTSVIASDALVPITRGCGSFNSGATIDEAITDADVQLVGTSPLGHKLYQIKNQSNGLFAKAYSEYAGDAQALQNGAATYTADQFQADHILVLFKDALGRWLVYERSSKRMMGGCAKPVIYLYPTVVEPVSVKVGARVTVSAPTYNPVSGWDTWASPTGTVWVDGLPYDSLFWEGTGFGRYPAITAGTVVARADAPSTMRRQLAQQGLRGHEIEDFLSYWVPKLPNTPYVRLTWFDTDQMNALAPLAITPRPDTLIRVFLDFDGLQEPMSLPAQQLSAPARSGFTAVEWGGLANFPLGK